MNRYLIKLIRKIATRDKVIVIFLAISLAIVLGIGVVVLTGTPPSRGEPAVVSAPAPTPRIAPPSTPSGPVSVGTLLPPGLASPPQSGWLYIIDPNMGGDQAQVLLVEPQQGSIQGVFRTGHAPEMLPSPDGTRIYLISSEGSQSWLSVIDTRNGATLQKMYAPYRAAFGILPSWQLISISPDGRWLYVLKLRTLAPSQDEYTIATFDTTGGRFLPEEAPVPGCGGGILLPSPVERQVHIVCPATNDVRFLQLTATGAARAKPENFGRSFFVL